MDYKTKRQFIPGRGECKHFSSHKIKYKIQKLTENEKIWKKNQPELVIYVYNRIVII